jgi:ATP-dependent helicase Lhr and Lhr-like helicase
LHCARADAATGMLDVARLGDLLTRVRGRILEIDLPKVSPFAVPLLLTIGRERVPGSMDWVLEGAEEDLIAEALS